MLVYRAYRAYQILRIWQFPSEGLMTSWLNSNLWGTHVRRVLGSFPAHKLRLSFISFMQASRYAAGDFLATISAGQGIWGLRLMFDVKGPTSQS
jgi:hypothetical protein